jgi:hypothetical protein
MSFHTVKVFNCHMTQSRVEMLELRQQGLGMGAIGKAVGLSRRTVWRFLRGVQAGSNVPGDLSRHPHPKRGVVE